MKYSALFERQKLLWLVIIGIIIIVIMAVYWPRLSLNFLPLFFKDSTINQIQNTSQSDHANSFQPQIYKVATVPSLDEITITEELATIDLPLMQEDFYAGKYANACAAAKELSKHFENIVDFRKYALIKDNIITFKTSAGYVTTKYGFGYGLCWAVTALGKVQEIANQTFKEKYGFQLFNFVERHGHSRRYSTYAPVNNGYGYAILKTPNRLLDYIFFVNPKTFEIFTNARISIIIDCPQNKGYLRQNVSAKVTISYTKKLK